MPTSSTLAFPSATASIQHPTYTLMLATWRKLADVFEGTGGFADGTYLVAHPREYKDWSAETPRTPTKKLLARRKLARYENVAATILEQKQAALFRESITRTVGGEARENKEAAHPLEEWWDNVDGDYCDITSWISDAWIMAGLFGHVFHYMDRDAAPVATAADQTPPFLRCYTPLDCSDWIQNDRGKLTAVKFLEAAPRTDISKAFTEQKPRERVITETEWQLHSHANGQTDVTRGAHQFAALPVVVQYAKRRRLLPLIGASTLNDPNLYIDLYNLTSEIRELLRNETFGMLNVELGTGEHRVGVVEAQTMMGDEKGSENVLFTPGPANFISPDPGNVEAHQKERAELLRTIYRLAAIPWEADSKDAEAEGSLKLKREDMNQVLAKYAEECQKAEYQIAELWFRSQYGADWEREYDKAEVEIRYPKSFDVTPFAEIIEQSTAAIGLEMPPTAMNEIRKRLVSKFLPEASKQVLDEIEKEMKAMPVTSPAQQRAEEMKLKYGAGAGGPGAGA